MEGFLPCLCLFVAKIDNESREHYNLFDRLGKGGGFSV